MGVSHAGIIECVDGPVTAGGTDGVRATNGPLAGYRLVGLTSAPTLTAGTALGSGGGGPIMSVSGNDLCGTLSLSPGDTGLSAPTGSGQTLVTVAFNQPPASGTPVVTVTPANSTTAALELADRLFQSAGSTGSFSLSIYGTQALVYTTDYAWNYHVAWR